MLIGAAGASAQQPAHPGGAQEGHGLALAKCDSCHVVASDQQIPPLLPHYAPSFDEVANRPGTNAISLEVLLAKPHAIAVMPYPQLTADQVTDLVSYILSLRRRRRLRWPYSGSRPRPLD